MSFLSVPVKKLGLATLVGIAALGLSGVEDAQAYKFDILDGQTCAAEKVHIPSSPNLMVYADSSASMREPGVSGVTESIASPVSTAGTIDEGLQVEAANAPGNPENRPGISLSHNAVIPPYAWIANTFHDYHGKAGGRKVNNTVSKLDMETNEEVGRYTVGSDPSRTAVDLDGNAWITGRASGWVTKILWNKDECPDRDGNGVINTSSGTNLVTNDECVVYHAQPNGSNAVIRGVAAGPDGRVWVGYTDPKGGIQSIRSNGNQFTVSSFIEAKDIPLYTANGQGVFVYQNKNAPAALGGSGKGGNGNYGLVIDSDGILYYAMVNSEYLLAFDTNTNKWKAAYHTPGVNAQYGIAIDSKKRVWLGGWTHISGVRMFDPNGSSGMQVHHFPVTSQLADEHFVTGVAVQPGTGDVWASFYKKGNTGILRFNENNYKSFTWTEIGTTRVNSAAGGARLPEVHNPFPDLRGVGFDMDGHAWAVGLGSDHVFKLDKVTGKRLASVKVGTGEHYTYSDFTGSTALSFTAPSGKWGNIYDVGGKQVLSIKVEGNVPTGTNIGVRYRGLDASGAALPGGWSPATAGGTEMFHQFVSGQQSLTIQIPQSNDNPFVVDKLQIEVRLSTSDKGMRPYLYNVSMELNPAPTLWSDVQNVAADLSASFGVSGGCTEEDGTGCDTVRVGLAYFGDGITGIAGPGEDTGDAISAGVAGAATGGVTGINQVAAQLLASAQLQDTSRSNFALVVTDGRFNTVEQVADAIRDVCAARNRPSAPVMTYVMGPGATSNMGMNSLLAAAGGTGLCCEGNHQGSCLAQNASDVCSWSRSKLLAGLVTSGVAPYSEVDLTSGTLFCSGATPTSEVTAFKTRLSDLSREQGCTFALHIPEDPLMYNKPNFPQIGAMEDPSATHIRINHKDWSLVDVPYCPDGEEDCGFSQNLLPLGIGEPILTNFADEGWYFVDDQVRDKVRFTDKLCSEISSGRVKNTSSQVACQCSLQGEACTVPGLFGRCAAGIYACDEGEVNVCRQVHRPMPEICNGLDDDCDGSIDNLTTTAQVVPKLPAEFAHLQCLNRDACVCPSGGSREYLGMGLSANAELQDFLTKSQDADSGCYCSGGLEAGAGASEGASSEGASSEGVRGLVTPESRSSSGKNAASCAVSGGLGDSTGGASAALALAGAFVWWRRRK